MLLRVGGCDGPHRTGTGEMGKRPKAKGSAPTSVLEIRGTEPPQGTYTEKDEGGFNATVDDNDCALNIKFHIADPS